MDVSAGLALLRSSVNRLWARVVVTEQKDRRKSHLRPFLAAIREHQPFLGRLLCAPCYFYTYIVRDKPGNMDVFRYSLE